MIFDVHTHLSLFGPEPGSADRADIDRMLRRMDRCGVDRAMLLGPVMATGPDPSPEQIDLCNSHTLSAMAIAPDRFSGLCYLNPAHDPSVIRDQVQHCLDQGPMCGIKLWVAVNARDVRTDRVVEHALRLDCPLLIHAWYKTNGQVYNESDPSDIAELARRHPQAKIVMAHLNGGGVRGVLDVAACPNVCVDTSGAQPSAGILEYAIETLGARRILYGSDWPVRDFAPQLGKLALPMLSPADREHMTSGNTLRLFNRQAACLSM